MSNPARSMRITTQHTITRSLFGKLLGDALARDGESVEEKLKTLSKLEAKQILKKELFWYGRQGEWSDGALESATDVAEARNNNIELASQWIEKNYPNLPES